MRIEKDSMGEIQVPGDKYWGAQTERSRRNFNIGWETMPKELITAYAMLKSAAAKVNHELGLLSEAKADAIRQFARKSSGEIWKGIFRYPSGKPEAERRQI